MKSLFGLSLFFFALSLTSVAQSGDTLRITPKDLEMKNLQLGDYAYVITHQKAKDSPTTGIVFVRMNVEAQVYNGRPAIIIKQKWDRDSVIHTSYSVFDPKDFSTRLHNTYWRQLGFAMIFDFDARKVDFKNIDKPGEVPDSIKTDVVSDFNASFEKYNLNWHEDLIVYTVLPYKEHRTFLINYFDPGFGKSEEVAYTVTGSEFLTGRDGEKIDCWVLNHDNDNKSSANGYERFWITKKSREVLKEEDWGKRGGYRYKYKIGVSGV